MLREQYQRTLAERHQNKLIAEENANFRQYKDRGYKVNLRWGEVYHVSGNRWEVVGYVLKSGLVVWAFNNKICGYITEDEEFHSCPGVSGAQYPVKGGVK